jgi:hypothetical protein
MKKIIALLIVILLHYSKALAQAPGIEWSKCYGGDKGEAAASVKAVPGGGYIVAGQTVSQDGDVTGYHDGQDGWVVKTDDTGKIEWERCLGGTDLETVNGMGLTVDNGCILAISTFSSDGDVTDNMHADGTAEVWIVKLNATGAIDWQKCYGGLNSDEISSIAQTADGGYIMAGNTSSTDGDVSHYTYGSKDAWIVKLDDTGAMLWQKKIGGSNDDYATSIMQTQDGGYITAGYTYSTNGNMSSSHGQEDGWAARLDDTGGTVWIKCLGGSGNDALQDVIETAAGNYIFTGAAASADGDVNGNHGDYDYWVLECGAAGAVLWSRCYGGGNADHAYSISRSADGKYIVDGTTASANGDLSENFGQSDCWVIKLNDVGDMLWQKSLGGSGFDEAFCGAACQDGSYIMGGTSYSTDGEVQGNHSTYSDIWLVKLSPFAAGVCETGYRNDIMIVPNPSDGRFTVTVPAGSREAQLTLTNVLGEVLLQKDINGITEEINVDTMPGIYLVTIFVDGEVYCSKLVLE